MSLGVELYLRGCNFFPSTCSSRGKLLNWVAVSVFLCCCHNLWHDTTGKLCCDLHSTHPWAARCTHSSSRLDILSARLVSWAHIAFLLSLNQVPTVMTTLWFERVGRRKLSGKVAVYGRPMCGARIFWGENFAVCLPGLMVVLRFGGCFRSLGFLQLRYVYILSIILMCHNVV